jgi:hypothetical protein
MPMPIQFLELILKIFLSKFLCKISMDYCQKNKLGFGYLYQTRKKAFSKSLKFHCKIYPIFVLSKKNE